MRTVERMSHECSVIPITGVIDVIGVDPGGKTGLAHYLASVLEKDKAWFHSMEGDPSLTLDYVERYLQRHPATVVYERFIPRRGPYTHQRHAPDTIGGLIDVCRRHSAPCHAQNASEAKSLFDNAILRKFGFYLPRSEGHANDAARHVAFGVHRLWPYEMLALRKGNRIATRVD